MKDPEKDRNRTLQTANDFAADVQRYLTERAGAGMPAVGGVSTGSASSRGAVKQVVALMTATASSVRPWCWELWSALGKRSGPVGPGLPIRSSARGAAEERRQAVPDGDRDRAAPGGTAGPTSAVRSPAWPRPIAMRWGGASVSGFGRQEQP